MMKRRHLLKSAALAAIVTPLVNSEPASAAAPSKSKVRIRRTGWAGIQIESGDKVLFVDPESMFDKRPELGIKSVPLESSASWRFVAVTHLHRDHFDIDAVKSILKSPDDLVICFEKSAAHVASRQLPVTSLAMYEPFSAGEYEADDITPSRQFLHKTAMAIRK